MKRGEGGERRSYGNKGLEGPGRDVLKFNEGKGLVAAVHVVHPEKVSKTDKNVPDKLDNRIFSPLGLQTAKQFLEEEKKRKKEQH